MIDIQPQYLPLSKLLDGRLFCIPEYQRAYSWTRHQRDDLFEDLKKTHAKGRDEGHFMSAVVCLRREKKELGTDEFQVLEIVDGQQRLTTLIVLLKAICLALNQDKRAERKLYDELQELLVKPDSDELLLLQTNHDSSHHFANYLRKGKAASSKKAATTADREILEAIESCEVFVEKWKNDSLDLLSLAALLKNRLYFLLHEIEQEKIVYTVFEVLNSRGLTVSWLDRLKSILMGMAFEYPKINNASLIKELHTTWRDIYSVIGLRQGMSTEALRFAATLRSENSPSRTLGEEDAVDVLRREASSGAARVRNIASWMLDVTRACDLVVANNRMNAVTGIAQARLLAVAISLRDDILPSDREDLLSRWEKVTFRIYGMLGNDARTRVGDYVRLAWRVVNEKPSASEISAGIGDIGSEFSIDEAIAELSKANCYEGWEIELRYFMFKYEEFLSKKQGMKFQNEQWKKIWMASPADSIEHIFPKSKAPKRHKHRLGNLVLLPPRLNSQLQDKPAKSKPGDYTRTGLLIAGKVADLIKKRTGWTVAEIDEREKELLAWAAKEWSD